MNLLPFRNGGPIVDLTGRFDVTVYDAAYLALAASLDGTMYTSDKKLIDAVRSREAAFEGHLMHLRDVD